MPISDKDKLKRITALLGGLDKLIRSGTKTSFTQLAANNNVRWSQSALTILTSFRRVGLIKEVHPESPKLRGIYEWTPFANKYDLEGKANLILQDIQSRDENPLPKAEVLQEAASTSTGFGKNRFHDNPSNSEEDVSEERDEVLSVDKEELFEHTNEDDAIIGNRTFTAAPEKVKVKLQGVNVETKIAKLSTNATFVDHASLVQEKTDKLDQLCEDDFENHILLVFVEQIIKGEDKLKSILAQRLKDKFLS